jgi:hypothetical protein
MAKKAKAWNVELEFVRATKNFLRYEGGEDDAIPTLYIRKGALEGQPKSITVTVQ